MSQKYRSSETRSAFSGQSKTVLIVDDDIRVLSLLKQVLEKEGYRVLAAKDGDEAFRVSLESEGSLDVLLTDVLLPGINGVDLMLLFETQWPKIKTILFSGQPDGAPGLPVGKSGTPFLPKPFSRETLLRTLGDVLRSAPPSEVCASQRRQAILVVDDEPSIGKLLKQFLASLGYDVRFAATGREALALIDKAAPDLVLLDIYMPHVNGVEVLKHLRASWPEELPFGVIILTGSRDEPLLQQTFALGAFEVLLKPVSLEQLELAVRVQLLLKEPRRSAHSAGLPGPQDAALT
jgi:CheY-like chemotaxis protein